MMLVVAGSRNSGIDIGQVERAFVQYFDGRVPIRFQPGGSQGMRSRGEGGWVQKDVKYQTGYQKQRSIMEYVIPSHRSIPRKMVSLAL